MMSAVAMNAQSSLLDPTFNTGSGANGIIETVRELPTGKILICGNFTVYDNYNNSYIAELNSDGSPDTNFLSSVSYWVRTFAVQPDGRILIGGFFTSVAGQPRNLIARLNSDGSLDTNFNPGLGAVGTLGTGIDGDSDPFVFAIGLQPDGKIVITGNFTNYNGVNLNGICRLNSDGSLDTNFNVGGGFNTETWGRSLLVQSNGQIIATGWFTSYHNESYNRMVRINSDGSPDPSFTPYFGDLTAVYNSVQLADGQYLVVGDSENTNEFTQCQARLLTNGVIDPTWPGQDNDKTESLCLQPDGKVVIGGYFSEMDGVARAGVARLNADGTLDTSFSADLDNFAWYVSMQSDGKILISGGFTTVDGQARGAVARLLSSAAPTLLSPAWNSNSFTVSVATSSNVTYQLQYSTNLSGTNWATVATVSGNGTNQVMTDANAIDRARYYRVLSY